MIRALSIALVVASGLACKVGNHGAPSGSIARAPGEVAITVDAHGFTPSAVDVKKGEKTTLVFTRTTDDTCATEVVFPEIAIKKSLPLNTPVSIDVPTDTARTLTFQCGMGMFKSKVVIR